MPRDNQIIRGLTTVAAATAGVRANLAPYDRITGEVGGLMVKLTIPNTAALIGDVFADVFVGQNMVTTNYVIPVEEFTGSGPNLRTPGIPIRGGRGDSISIVYRNVDAATAAPITHHIELANFGR